MGESVTAETPLEREAGTSIAQLTVRRGLGTLQAALIWILALGGAIK
jgi:hypothetical protein